MIKVLLVLALSAAAAFGQADGIDVLHSFQNNGDGAAPQGTLVETSPGVFVGATSGGNSGSTLFQVTNSGAFEVLATFNPNTQGYLTAGQLYPASNGFLYGANDAGIEPYTGSLLAASTSGRLHILQSDSYNATPLIEASDGNLYGVEENAATGDYSVFRMTLAGTITAIYNLGPNGHVTGSLLQASDGNLYGMTTGFNDVAGLLFRVSLSGEDYAVIHTFEVGAGLSGPLMEASNGLLYGTALYGYPSPPCPGVNELIFSVSLSGDYHPLIPFEECDGLTFSGPVAGLTEASDGKIYGETRAGGGYSTGTVFRFNLDGSSFESLVNIGYGFGALPGGFDGPALIQGSDGGLYSEASSGGTYQYGTVFRVNVNQTPPLPVVSLLAPQTGAMGTSVRIAGQHLLAVSQVSFNGVSAAFTSRGTNYVIAVVPSGATTGPVTVITASGSGSSKSTFTVK